MIYETSLGVSTKKLQMSHETHLVVSRSANITNLETFPENTFQNQQLEHTLGGFKKSPCSFCGDLLDLNGPQRFKGEQKTPVPHVRFLANRRPSHIFCQVLLKPSHCLLLGNFQSEVGICASQKNTHSKE